MKIKRISIALSIIPLILCACNNKTSNNRDKNDEKNINAADIVLDVDFNTSEKSSFEINPFVYGTFIEFIENCIYGGIWAEKVLDRKFYNPIGEGVSAWRLDKGEISALTGDEAFQQNYSPTLKEGSKISQDYLMALEEKEYTGYVWAKGHGVLSISLNQGKNVVSKDITINSDDYQKYNYSITYNQKSKAVTYSIESKQGEITFDSISMMPGDNYKGMRLDTLQALKELGSPLYRYPGGNFVSGYDFYDGIGDIDKRPTVLNRHYCKEYGYYEGDDDEDALGRANQAIGMNGWYGAFDPNDFGLEEFFEFCEYLNTEPNIVVNSGLGSAQMAADEVEFCNGSSSSTWGSKRMKSKEPYNVKIWGVGNEMYGSWQLGNVPLSTYVKRHNEFAVAMKKIDPSIKLIAVGANNGAWSQGMVDSCKGNIDYLSEHWYPQRQETNVKQHILALKNMTETRIQNHRDLNGVGNIKMAIDEYAYAKAEEPSRLKDGMGVASALNVMIKNGDVVDIACYSSTVNAVQGNVITKDFGAYMEGSGYALSLYAKNMQDYYLPVKYKDLKDIEQYYEVSATINKEKTKMTISVINASDNILCVKNNAFKKIISEDYFIADNYFANNTDTRNDLKRFTNELNQNASTFVVDPLSVKLLVIDI